MHDNNINPFKTKRKSSLFSNRIGNSLNEFKAQIWEMNVQFYLGYEATSDGGGIGAHERHPLKSCNTSNDKLSSV